MQRVVAGVISARVSIELVVGYLQGPGWRGVGGEGEERPTVVLNGVDKLDEPIRVELRRVAALGIGHGLAVLGVDRAAFEEAQGVEVIARTVEQVERPLEAGCLRAVLGFGAQVPLAHGEGVVARLPQPPWPWSDATRQVGLVSFGGDAPIGPSPLSCHSSHVVVVAAQQHGSGGRAEGRRVELGEQQPGVREGVDVRGPDIAAVCAQIGVAQVVGDDEQDVGPGVAARWGRARGGGEQCRRQEDGGKAGSAAVLATSACGSPRINSLRALVFSLFPGLGVRGLALVLVAVLLAWAAAAAALRSALPPPADR